EKEEKEEEEEEVEEPPRKKFRTKRGKSNKSLKRRLRALEEFAEERKESVEELFRFWLSKQAQTKEDCYHFIQLHAGLSEKQFKAAGEGVNYLLGGPIIKTPRSTGKVKRAEEAQLKKELEMFDVKVGGKCVGAGVRIEKAITYALNKFYD